MIVAYTIFNILIAWMAKRQFKKAFNPVTLYAIVWEVAIMLHESGLIRYYPLTMLCWAMIFIFELVFFLGCVLGHRTIFLGITNETKTIADPDLEKKYLIKWIVITLIISGIGIVGSLLKAIQLYGTNLLAQTTNIYANRVYNNEDLEFIPYIGSFIYIEMALAGIYLKKYGFNILLVWGFVLTFFSALTSGGRAGIVFNAIIFISAYLLSNTDRKIKHISGKQKILFAIIIVALVLMINIITNQRVAGISLTFATERFIGIFGNNVAVYKIISYIANPIGTLNEYLKVRTFSFGQNTFLPIYNILARFENINRVNQYQEDFFTPMRCNVGTWIRELIEDFTIPGAIFFALVFAFAVGYQYREAQYKNTNSHIVVSSALIMIMTLSFFDWKFRTSGLWIAIFLGYFIGRNIDHKCRILVNDIPVEG